MSETTEPAKPLTRQQMAWRAAQDVEDGCYVNLGIGIPTLVSGYIPAGREVLFHAENGILGLGRAPGPDEGDDDLIDAGLNPVTLITGGCFFEHTESFLMIRGGHLDISILGAFEVSGTGDLANWITNDPAALPAVGGAMDLAVGARAVWAILQHTTREGAPRIRTACTYPLTGVACVTRIYTDLAVIDVTADGLVVREMVDGIDLAGLQALTEPPLALATDWRRLAPPAL